MPAPERLVRRTLAVNAALSALTGVVLLVDAVPLADLLGLEEPLALRIVGAGLLPFAAAAAWASRHAPLARGAVVAISVLDAAWVLGTLGLAALAPTTFNTLGWAAAGVTALAVDACFTGQVWGLRGLRVGASGAPLGYAPHHAGRHIA